MSKVIDSTNWSRYINEIARDKKYWSRKGSKKRGYRFALSEQEVLDLVKEPTCFYCKKM